jgi:hypothetical protein
MTKWGGGASRIASLAMNLALYVVLASDCLPSLALLAL